MITYKLLALLFALLDYKYRRLENWLMYPINLVLCFFVPPVNLIWGLLCFAFSLWLCQAEHCGRVVKKGLWYGGDIKLFTFYGFAFGWQGLLTAITCSLIILLRRKQLSSKPVAPLAFWICLLI